MINKQQYRFQKGDILLYKPKGVKCKCLSVDQYGDIIYILGEELNAKGPHRYFRYEEDKWEKVDDS